MADKKMRLGLDIGANSIGWCLYDIVYNNDNEAGEIVGIVDGGSRVFASGRKAKGLASLNADRRAARGMRRGFTRSAQRRQWLLNALAKAGLFPAKSDDTPDLQSEQAMALQKQDPLKLRDLAAESAKALAKFAQDANLNPKHLVGRALFHMNQRRGYQSNAKTDDEKDTKVVGKARDGLNAARGDLTVGQHLSARHQKGKPTRARPAQTGTGGKIVKYEPLYPFRDDLRAEFDQIWQTQNPGDGAVRKRIREIIFNQRGLKKPVVGRCPFYPEDSRAPQALPSFQQFRILQDLNNLEYADGEGVHSLSGEAREKIHAELLKKKEVKFDDMRKILGNPGAKFNLERPVKRTRGKGKNKAAPLDEKPLRQNIKGDVVGCQFKAALGSKWRELATDNSDLLAAQDELVAILLDENENKARRHIAHRWELTQDEIDNCIKCIAKLPKQRARFGGRAIREVIPYLGAGMHLDKAINAAQEDDKLGEKKQRDGDASALSRLPRYQDIPAIVRYCAPRIPAECDKKNLWRIPNPTVHIGLNQLRLVVNDILRIHGKRGKIAEVALEIARELPMGAKRRLAQNREKAANRDNNERIAAILKKHGFSGADARDQRARILKYILWEELAKNPHDRKCVYCGTQISVARLFNGEVEIEHILPFHDTLDNSRMNKTLACVDCNRNKQKRAPYDAQNSFKSDWDGILSRARRLPFAKFKRFQKGALEKYKFNRDGFLPRHLPETQYLSRVAMQYLKALVGDNKVYVVPGRITALLRNQWGLNSILAKPDGKGANDNRAEKNRADHRHHAIDAAVIAATTRGMLQKVATVAAKEDDSRFLFADDVPPPMENFWRKIAETVQQIIVSHKPNRRREGELHEKTAYGIVDDSYKFTHRVTLDKVTVETVHYIRDDKTRNAILALINKAHERGEDPQAVIKKYLTDQKMRFVQFLGPKFTHRVTPDKVTVKTAHYIRDNKTRNAVFARIAGARKRGKDPQVAIAEYLARRNLRHVQLLEPMSVVPIGSDKDGNRYKAYKTGGNWAYQIFAVPEGRDGEKWDGKIITTFDANKHRHKAKASGAKETIHPHTPCWRKEHPRAKLVMRIHAGDMIAFGEKKARQIFRVQKLSEGKITLTAHFEARADKSIGDKAPDTLRKEGGRKIHISPAGLICDQGPLKPPPKKK